jgi:hypothetical protein
MAKEPNASPSNSLVDRVKNILLQPKAEWPRIDAEPATVGGIYRNYVVILAAVGPVAGALGMLIFDFHMFGISYRPSPLYVVSQAVVQYLLSLVSVYLLALIIEALAPTFGGTKDRVSAFKVAAYGATASWLAGIFGIIPNLAFLSIVGLYSLYLFYLGLPILMKVPADRIVGYIAAIIVAAIVLFFIVGAVTAQVAGAFAPLPTAGGTLSIPYSG